MSRASPSSAGQKHQEGREADYSLGLRSKTWPSWGWPASRWHIVTSPIQAQNAAVIPLEGLLVLALVALAAELDSPRRPSRSPSPRLIQKNIKTSLLALIWLHVGVIASVRGLEAAAVVALLWVPAFILGRWLYST